MMTLVNRIGETAKLWALMLPQIPAPDPAWMGRWCAESDRFVEHGIIRASKKFGVTPVPNPEVVWRYVSGVIANEAATARAISSTRSTAVEIHIKGANEQ
ncbi:hypothetical protein [Granulicella sp. L46]|uniref:hypothetical protein n=1 Tax=Granulicella sp. L46 TaxID=1641865 RepID=UPI00131C2B51|nr:hypothetical protein [Granulicella sp. L46]